MNGLNKVYIMGRLGGAPEMKQSAKGRPYAVLRIATDRPVKKEDGDWSTEPDWHSVFVWGTLAETCTRHLRKGAVVFVEGHLRYWQESATYKNSISADSVNFLNVRHLDNAGESRNPDAVAHPA